MLLAASYVEEVEKTLHPVSEMLGLHLRGTWACLGMTASYSDVPVYTSQHDPRLGKEPLGNGALPAVTIFQAIGPPRGSWRLLNLWQQGTMIIIRHSAAVRDS